MRSVRNRLEQAEARLIPADDDAHWEERRRLWDHLLRKHHALYLEWADRGLELINAQVEGDAAAEEAAEANMQAAWDAMQGEHHERCGAEAEED
jgi:hypothetical protein